jgi:hypothetical protein
MCLHRKNIFKIYSRTTGPKELKFTLYLSDIVKKRVCGNHGPMGAGGATIGETFLYVLIQGTYLKIFAGMGPKSSYLHKSFQTRHTQNKHKSVKVIVPGGWVGVQ